MSAYFFKYFFENTVFWVEFLAILKNRKIKNYRRKKTKKRNIKTKIYPV